MTDGRMPWVPRPFQAFALLLIGAACAPPPPPEPPVPVVVVPVPEPLTPTEIEAAAVLLRLEDRREFDDTLLADYTLAPEGPIRARTALAAGRIGTSSAAQVVRYLLIDTDTAVAAAAAFMAGQLRDTASTNYLATFLDLGFATARPTVAAEAAGALGKIGTADARTALSGFLRAVDRRDPRLLPVVKEALIASWRAGEADVELYPDWLRHDDPEIRWRATYALSRRPRADAVPLLVPMLDDSEPLVRAFAIRGLTAPLVSASGIPRGQVLEALVETTRDSAYVVRIEAIRALGTYDEPTSLALLEDRAFSESAHEAIVAIEALSRLGPEAAGGSARLLRVLLDSSDTPHYIRGAALEAVATLDPVGAPQLLERYATDSSWRVRAAVARALSQRGAEGLPLLEVLARDLDPKVAVAAIDGAVTAIGSGSVRQIQTLLLEQLQHWDPHVRAAVLRALADIPDPALYPFLLDAYDGSQFDLENEAALAALDAIAALGRTAQLSPERAFFVRFPRPDDHLVRLRADSLFPDAAAATWGEPLPAETRYSAEQYRRFVLDWLAPAPPERSLPRIRIETEEGVIEAELFGDEAPLTVGNFLALAEDGFFDGQEWPRVVPNFVVQGGDPRGDTSGGPGYTIRDELNRSRYLTGTIGMALSGPDTGGSQFFIAHLPQPHLDGTYTVFGAVVSGQDVLERIIPGQRIISIRPVRTEG